LTGAKVYGVEPANDTYSPLRKCIDEFITSNPHIPYEPLLQGGENISLPDESIDFIYSLEVLEHVQDPQKVLFEVYRLLKKGGKAYIATNNYDSFYEGHYKKFWNPFIGPSANKRRYIKQGLSPQFFNELNFITKKQLMSYIKNCGFSHFMFNPPIVSNQLAVELEAVLPDNFQLSSTGKNIKPTKLHRFIEKPRVNGLLSRFDREYKLYVLLTK
jgi:ubiquinone/menaquinone biosynthesis C-methylase UbiE